jgi:vacuolar protein sorting-associated protein 26
MDFGIPDFLNIEVDFEKSKYHLKDVIKGTFSTRLLNIKIKHVEICMNKREVYGPQSNQIIESKVISRVEVMDGNPQLNERVPIRLYLSSIDGMTPTQKNIANKFSCHYLLNIMIHDDEGRRYFKN